MRTRIAATVGVLMVGWLLLPVSTLATDGYFAHGYGTKSQGMGGAGVAFPLGPLSPATNPAGLALSGPGLDIGVGLCNPNRQYEVMGNPSGYPGTFGMAPGVVESGGRLFPVPHAGVSWRVGSTVTLGLATYGGGMNTNYDAPTFGVAPTGINMSQLFVAPTVGVRLNDNHAVGVTAVLGYQMFKAEGLRAFSPFSVSPSNMTDNGTDSSVGAGVRVGYLGQVSKHFSIGASYQSKVLMGEFDKYSGLFAEGGDFDVPSNWTVGIGITPTGTLDIAIDVQHMRYSEITSVGSPMLPNLMQAALGSANGAGFGWEDMTVVKAGLQHRVGDGFVWRAGYSYGKQPIPDSEAMFSILAPGVIEQHATLGFSKAVSAGRAIDVAVTRAFNKTLTGPNRLEVPGLQTIGVSMNQWNVTIGYSMYFR